MATAAHPAVALGPSAALARLAEGSDAAAWSALAEALGDEVERLCRRLTGDAQEAADAVQETWLLLRDRAERFQPRSGSPDDDARRWALRVAANIALQAVRRRKVRRAHARRAATAGSSPGDEPVDHLVADERAALVREALARVAEPARSALVLRHVVGLGFKDIAGEFGCPEGTAKAWVHRGLERMRADLRRSGVDASVAAIALFLPQLPVVAGAPLAAVGVSGGAKGLAALKVKTMVIGAAVIAVGTIIAIAVPALRRPAAATTIAASAVAAAESPLARWERRMLEVGAVHAVHLHRLRDGDLDQALAAIDGDAAEAFSRIADRSGDQRWRVAAEDAVHIYRDRYVLPHDGAVPGYELFPLGLLEDWRRTHDARSRDALIALAEHGAYATGPEEYIRGSERAEEVASQILVQLAAAEVGHPREEWLRVLVGAALGHLDQWFVQRTATVLYPHVFGLTARALIAYDRQRHDARVLPALTQALDTLWAERWLPDSHAFVYADRPGFGRTGPAGDLSLLIAPAYAWAWERTGEQRFRERADAIFAGGVEQASIDGAKQFTQSYGWAFDYVASAAPRR
jgi:RNA polymerase sigma factor (sigma-70 family)